MDLDGDKRPDILSGSWFGEIYLFQGLGRGQFAASRVLQHEDGRAVDPEGWSAVSAADWDGDGDFDLLIGDGYGHVHLVPNRGSRTKYVFGQSSQLAAAGQTIEVPDGEAGPAAADWDGDGKLDLLVGAGDGSVWWFRNAGTPHEPVLAAGQVIVPAPQEGSPRGIRAKICAVDWNHDGLLDIVLGDHGAKFDKQLSEAEELWRQEAQRQQAEMMQSWATVFREYRRALQDSESGPAEARPQRLDALRAQLQSLNRIRDKYHQDEQALEPGSQYHGRVWLLIRRPPDQRPAKDQ